jgi:hypothetical protein
MPVAMATIPGAAGAPPPSAGRPDLRGLAIPPALIALLDAATARAWRVIPVRLDGGSPGVLVLGSDRVDTVDADLLRLRLGVGRIIVIDIGSAEVDAALARYYAQTSGTA